VLAGKQGVANHVIVVTHLDELGRWIGIQGQPGGVGPCDCTGPLNNRLTRSNHAQPRADDKHQTARFLAAAAKSLGLRYDWVGIAEDGLDAVGAADFGHLIDPLWRWPSKGGLLPGHVVCSSLAAMLYEYVGWAHPDLGRERVSTPPDWWAWSDSEAWKAAA
jgi:hypothetical protein